MKCPPANYLREKRQLATAFPANQPCRICSSPLPICTRRGLGGNFPRATSFGATLAAIELLVPAANAIVQNDTASAWRGASDSDTRIARGEAHPLEGLPVTIKDCFEVAGMVTSAGAPALQNYTRLST